MNSSKRQSLCTPSLPSGLSVDIPISQLLRRKFRLPTPFQRERPSLVTDPVAYPIVRAYVDKHLDTTLKKSSNVVFSGVETILSGAEVATHVAVTRCEVGGQGRIDTEQGANVRIVEVLADVPSRISGGEDAEMIVTNFVTG